VRGLQKPEIFSSSAIVALDPDPIICMKPIQLDPPEHTKWRKMLASYFSVKRMPHLEERIRQRVTELLDEYLPKGECDFVQDIAMWFPSVIFLEIVGLPVDELPTFLDWERNSLHADPGQSDREAHFGVMMQVMARFQRAIDERRANPTPDATDIISHAVAWEIDGRAVSDGDVLECFLLLFLAGLDTVTNELSYAIWHLATHPEDRAALREDPRLIPQAVGELLRVFSIPQLARKVTRDGRSSTSSWGSGVAGLPTTRWPPTSRSASTAGRSMAFRACHCAGAALDGRRRMAGRKKVRHSSKNRH
jgi:cytochrome P450